MPAIVYEAGKEKWVRGMKSLYTLWNTLYNLLPQLFRLFIHQALSSGLITFLNFRFFLQVANQRIYKIQRMPRLIPQQQVALVFITTAEL